ncbi:raffinose/stachyose/melibiose transport system permease protein [Anaerocolumna jejuensis DSM 15929]|uniref:Raffinose/stachyose/melibiose transport system permease protein n=1 Tax=Anaerocolumna jejuensis DSM 15929 TaxID=1121322 RepID=A0A1M7BJG6_9FIRM|nr:carbohydrate ABC transporter permease [Anaerocolumna jejuensis]SHL55120.1 raffinose/stachyose/melibiose transport system permease protein [Anaerocolumna jejuensis DSM 15929]
MKSSRVIGNLIKLIISLICVGIILMPLGILVRGSLQGGGISNYTDILTRYHIHIYFTNSFIISLCAVILVVLLDILAGFALSKLDFPFKNAIYIFLLSALLLPVAAILVPVFQINSKLGILNTYLAVLGPYIVLIAPFNLLTIKNGFDSLPNTVLEAALIDGCGILRSIYRIAIPMCKPAIIMAVIWTFLSSWNEYMMAFVMLRKEAIMTITVIPTKFQSMYGGNVGMLYAALFIILIPSIVIYLFLQKFIVNGLNTGAVKE